jgi:hypothetical protein
MERREADLVRWFSAFGLASVLLIMVTVQLARADIALCASFPTPSSEAQARRQAPFAFDGVVIRGREVNGPNGGVELLSPLTFRVTRWIKDGAAHGSVLPDGTEAVHIWDGRYARLPDRLLASYSLELKRRFPGELVALSGQMWRIYATSENGVNFTCTNLLGSHPLGPSESATASAPSRSLGPSNSSEPVRDWSFGVVLALLAAGTAALFAWARWFGTKRHRS